MEEYTTIAIACVASLVVGFILGRFIIMALNNKEKKKIEKQAEEIIQKARKNADNIILDSKEKSKRIIENKKREGENLKRKKLGEAKEIFAEKRTELENKFNNKTQSLKALEKNLTKRDIDLKSKENDLKRKQDTFNSQVSKVEQKGERLDLKMQKVDALLEEYQMQLEKVAKFTPQQAKEELIKSIKDKAETEAISFIKDKMEEAKLTANKNAKKIVIQSIQRMAAEYTIENTVSVFRLESDDIKGQIIGREGRNIRALEAATGVEIIVDDTPEAIVISSFDSVRREICRLSLQRLVADGRIHPARIEEVVAKTKKQIEEQILEIGQRTVIDLNIHGIQTPIVRMVGRMRFRSSYGQNLLKHSIETAKLCALMAAELGLSAQEVKLAKRAGLLHDIGKVNEEETELSHAIVGMKMCEKHGEKAAVANAVGAHHDEIEMKYIISPIVQACDAISGARPGARREILESYIERIHDLEKIALSYDGVQKVYAMQAGRELRVIVESEKVSDSDADSLSFEISQKIQDEMQYPGQIKVTVIREKRAIAFAR